VGSVGLTTGDCRRSSGKPSPAADHAFAFELAVVGANRGGAPAPTRGRSSRLVSGGPSTVTVSGIVLVPTALQQDSSFTSGGIADHARTCRCVTNGVADASCRLMTTGSLVFLAHWRLVPSRKPLWRCPAMALQQADYVLGHTFASSNSG
jgi:hypothetical protein